LSGACRIESRAASRRLPNSGCGPPPLRSWRPEEPHVESSEHQDNANIYYQPFPESVSEEREIYTNYNGYHRHRVKHFSCPSVHFNTMMVDGVGRADLTLFGMRFSFEFFRWPIAAHNRDDRDVA